MRLMTIRLNHTIVPARDKEAAAGLFAQLFGLSFEGVSVDRSESHHYAFHVEDAEFDAILPRVKAAGLSFVSAPWSIDDGELNDWNGGRGVYFKDRDGHILELMTVPQQVASPDAVKE